MNDPDAPHVSVVIPVGSVGSDFEEAFNAVIDQKTSFTFDVILSLNTPDPAAAVALEAIVAASPDAAPTTRVVPSFEQAGASYARNAGALASRAPILAFADADDVVEPDWLGLLVAGLDTDDAVSGFVSDDRFMSDQQRNWRPPTSPDGGLPSFMGHPYLLTCSFAINREAFDSVGGFDTTLTRCEDIAISWRLVQTGHSLGFVPESVIHYRHRDGLWPMLRQHFYYGRGMSEVLLRIGVPPAEGDDKAKNALDLLKPNGERVAQRSLGSTLRRASIAVGRLVGIADVKLRG